MSLMYVERDALLAASGRWTDLETLMNGTASLLRASNTAGLAPGIRAAGDAFLQTWVTYAAESAAIASGFADALRASASAYTAADESAAVRLNTLDGRLGPEQ
jgi:hypothetical protein